MLILVWSRNQLPSDALLFELCKSGNWKNLLCCGIIKPEPERIRDRAAEDENDDVDDEDDIDDNDDDESDADEVEDADEHVDETDEPPPPPPPTTPTPPPTPAPTTPPPIFGNKCFNSCMSLIT